MKDIPSEEDGEMWMCSKGCWHWCPDGLPGNATEAEIQAYNAKIQARRMERDAAKAKEVAVKVQATKGRK